MADRILEIAASGGDYTSFAAAIAGEPDFQAGEDNIIFRRTDNARESSGFTVTGFTTSSSHQIIVECSANVQHDGTRGSGAGIVGTSGYSALVISNIPYVKFFRLEIRNNGESGTALRMMSNNNIADSLLIYDSKTGIGSYDETVIVNCLIYNCSEAGLYYVIKHVYNCTILNCGSYGMWYGAWSPGYSKNNYSGGNVTYDIYDETGNFSHTTSASSDGSDSTTEIEVSACAFTSSTAGSEDANIGSGSDLIGAGTSLASDSAYPVTVDCFGTTRGSTPCIGAVEYVASGNTYYYQQQQM